MRRFAGAILVATALLAVLPSSAAAYPQVRNMALAPSLIECTVCHGHDVVGGNKGPHGGVTSATHVCKSCHWTVHDAVGGDLLFQTTATNTCRACHDGTGGAGIYAMTSFGVTPGAAHRIEMTATVPGGSATDGGSATVAFKGSGGRLGCSDCHSPHDGNTIAPFTHVRNRYAGIQSTSSNDLLRKRPTGSVTTATVYGSDWCMTCHRGRSSGGMVNNHPVDSLQSTATPFTYETVLTGGPPVPTPLAMSSDGSAYVYVADVGNHRVAQFSSAGAFVRSWPVLANGQLSALALTKDINGDGQRDLMTADVLETDAVNLQFRYWKQDGTSLGGGYQMYGPPIAATDNRAGTRAVGVAGSGVVHLLYGGNWQPLSGQIGRGDGVAMSPGGRVYIADSKWNRVVVLDSFNVYFQQLFAFPAGATPIAAGSGNGQFRSPMAIALGTDGSVYVADTGNDRVQKFTADGAYVAQWGTTGTGAGQFRRPTGITVADDGSVYVADSANHRIQRFTSAGAFLGSFGGPGKGSGQLSLEYSVGRTLAGSNQGFLMADPRMANQVGHGPICHQCHSDSRDPGTLVSGVPSATPYASFAGWGEGNPKYQAFPHETQNRRLLVRPDDALCLDCHAPATLP